MKWLIDCLIDSLINWLMKEKNEWMDEWMNKGMNERFISMSGHLHDQPLLLLTVAVVVVVVTVIKVSWIYPIKELQLQSKVVVLYSPCPHMKVCFVNVSMHRGCLPHMHALLSYHGNFLVFSMKQSEQIWRMSLMIKCIVICCAQINLLINRKMAHVSQSYFVEVNQKSADCM